MEIYHNPVLLAESVEGLNIDPAGTYVDVTFGGGGHANAILALLTQGRLFAFDQDNDAHQNKIEQKNFKLLHANFRYIKQFLRLEGVIAIDGLLADLGVSSHQFDVSERGFSIRVDGPLDMRMDKNNEIDAKFVVNQYSQEKLAEIFFRFGELREAKKIAATIVVSRQNKEINTTGELVAVVSRLTSERKLNQFLAKIFQAIRIEVNDEMGALQELLQASTDLLKQGGRLSVISYHSLEDRMVKNWIKTGNVQGELHKDFYGNPIKSLREIGKKVVVPTENEIRSNSRARSAKLRVAEKI